MTRAKIKVRVRDAAPKDYYALLRLGNDTRVGGEVWTPALMHCIRRRCGGRVFVALGDGGELLGFLVTRELGWACNLVGLHVAAKHRRRRVATQLMRVWQHSPGARGEGDLYVHVARGSNTASHLFLKSCGWRAIGAHDDYFKGDAEQGTGPDAGYCFVWSRGGDYRGLYSRYEDENKG